MNTYADAAVTFATARNKEAGKPLASSTRLHKRGDNYAVKYHDTYVVTYRPDGSIRLDTGGWLTMSTRQRVEEYLPAGYRLSSVKGRWYLVTPTGSYAWRDGITIGADGIVTGYEPADVVAVQDAENKALDKRVKAFTAALTSEVVADALDRAEGDCFGCRAPEVFGVEHLALHVEEGYYPARMLASAVENAGYRADVYLSGAAGGHADYLLRTVQQCLSGYLRGALLSGAVSVRHGRKPVGAVKRTWQRSA